MFFIVLLVYDVSLDWPPMVFDILPDILVPAENASTKLVNKTNETARDQIDCELQYLFLLTSFAACMLMKEMIICDGPG